MGLHELPEQTPVDQGRMQFQEKIKSKLSDYSESMEERGIQVSTKLVFTHKLEDTIKRVIKEENPSGFLILNPVTKIEKILLLAKTPEKLDGLHQLCKEMGLSKKEFGFWLLGKKENKGDFLEYLEQLENQKNVIEKRFVKRDKLIDEISEKSSIYDTIFMEEIGERFWELGIKLPEKIAKSSLGPILVIN
ncbi:MAG: Nucleotide-binding protein UspA family [Candidatus Methanohalarchaeum thermophilum]|uniref:Nucleotide-binding protein UspA family n=1 Tax=Methanohalarchaeum thermophilum TaxID=1903181 RepID=A0A1Q6DSB4_METT1|nr:MAG: Nucleotide-binding protein UspA family [Candidatus Methanohalarchaeum thermophilum]